MPYIAFLDQNNIVTQVVKAPNQSTDWCLVWGERYGCMCKHTSKTGELSHQYAVPGDTYHEDIDAFMSLAPYPSWVLNKSIPAWEAPVPKPTDPDFDYAWDEDTLSWKALDPNALLS